MCIENELYNCVYKRVATINSQGRWIIGTGCAKWIKYYEFKIQNGSVMLIYYNKVVLMLQCVINVGAKKKENSINQYTVMLKYPKMHVYDHVSVIYKK